MPYTSLVLPRDYYQEGVAAAKQAFDLSSFTDAIPALQHAWGHAAPYLSSLGHTALLGSGLHMGANVAQKGIRATGIGRRLFERNLLSSGFQHGQKGEQLHPYVTKAFDMLTGPETMEGYHVGRAAGQKSRGLGPAQTQDALQNASSLISGSKHLSDAPLVRSVPGMAEDVAAGKKSWVDKIPWRKPEGYELSRAGKALPMALGAGAAVLNPELGLHMGINTVRGVTAHSDFGQRFMEKQFNKGLAGKQMAPATSAATDLVVSPAAMDTRRIGTAMSKEIQDNPQQSRALLDHARGLLDPMLEGSAVPPEASKARFAVNRAGMNLPPESGVMAKIRGIRDQGMAHAARLFGGT